MLEGGFPKPYYAFEASGNPQELTRKPCIKIQGWFHQKLSDDEMVFVTFFHAKHGF